MFVLFSFSAVLMILLGGAYYRKKNDWPLRRSLPLKAGCTLVTVLLCLVGLLWTGKGGMHWLLFVGLCVCMAADVVIGLHFVAGMVVFIAAHFCFITYYVWLAAPQWPSAVIFVLMYAAIVIGFWRTIPLLGKRLPAFAVYPAVLSAMLALAAPLPFLLGGTGKLLLACGALLFSVSDLILAYNVVVKESKGRDAAVLILYFSGVALFGASAFFP